MKIPIKPIIANAGHARRDGSTLAPCRRRMTSNSTTPSANRVKMRVGGEISRSAAFVATNETGRFQLGLFCPATPTKWLSVFEENQPWKFHKTLRIPEKNKQDRSRGVPLQRPGTSYSRHA